MSKNRLCKEALKPSLEFDISLSATCALDILFTAVTVGAQDETVFRQLIQDPPEIGRPSDGVVFDK